eukprot:m51a1_g3698 hypothetical protein (341) ;mRNA; r:385638-387496
MEASSSTSGGGQAETPRALFARLSAALEAEMERVEREGREAAEMRQKLGSVARQADTRVLLDIGGARFVTSTATLCSDPNSLFTALFAGVVPVNRQPDGSVFIDRSPRHFAAILDFLRTGTAHLAFYAPSDLAELLVEAQFFRLPALCRAVTAAMSATPSAPPGPPAHQQQQQRTQALGSPKPHAQPPFGWLTDASYVRIEGTRVFATQSPLACIVIADRAFDRGSIEWAVEYDYFAGPAACGVVAEGADRSRATIGDTADAWGIVANGRFRNDATEFDSGLPAWQGRARLSFRLDCDIGILVCSVGAASWSATVPRGVRLQPAIAAVPGCSYKLCSVAH